MRFCRRLALLLLTWWAIAPWGPLRAQTVPPAEPDLYQDALQSIAEGRRNDAFDMLNRLIEKEPVNAGAWLEIALIQCSLGHALEAERLFAAIETRFNPPIGILDLIADARDQGCSKWQAHSSLVMLTGRGYDQNVNQGTSLTEFDGRQLSADFLPMPDRYSTVSGEYTRDVSSNGNLAFAQFQLRRNDSLHQYDGASLFSGLEKPWRFGRWTLRGTGMLGLISLGGKLYQRQMQVQARVGPPVPLPGNAQFSVYGSATRTEYLTLANFNSNTYELRSQLTYRDENRYASASLGFLEDRASQAARPGGNRHGWLGNVILRRGLGGATTGELAYTRQSWQSETAYLPGVIEQVRSQATHVLRASLTLPLSKGQSLVLDWRAVRDKENISVFQYNSRQLQLSWQWQR
ncbi:MAG: tetratricopeptide repeat protein [Pseudomonadota bacterium]